MKRNPAPFLVLVLMALSLATGCTVPQGVGTPTPAPTQTVTTIPPSPAVTVPPGPVVTVPPAYAVAIQVTRNPNTAFPYITVAFRGGYGQYILQRITVTVARSDGLISQKVIPQSGENQYSVGDSVSITGTTGTDEVAVVATLNGVDYKIYDEFLTYGASP